MQVMFDALRTAKVKSSESGLSIRIAYRTVGVFGMMLLVVFSELNRFRHFEFRSKKKKASRLPMVQLIWSSCMLFIL